MKRLFLTFVGLLSAGTVIALAQPPGGPDGPGGREGRGGPGDQRGPGEGGPPPNLILEALDLDGDHVISASEIASAAQSLSKLDKNSDGKLDHDEVHPMHHRGGGERGRPERMGEHGAEGHGDHEHGARGRDGADGSGRRGRPDEQAGGRRGQREDRGGGMQRGGRGPGGPGGPGGGPPRMDEERMLSHAMGFDEDEDGMLSEDELKAFIADFAKERQGQGQMRRGREGAGGPDGDDRRTGPRDGGPRKGGPGGSGPRDGAGRDDGGRPDRPQRPE